MISYLPAFALTFALGLIVSLAVTPLARRLGEHRDIADRPGGRRQHRGVIPRLGGIALYVGLHRGGIGDDPAAPAHLPAEP